MYLANANRSGFLQAIYLRDTFPADMWQGLGSDDGIAASESPLIQFATQTTLYRCTSCG